MNAEAWLTKLPPITGSPTRLIKRAELENLFRRLAGVTLDVADANVNETPSGLHLVPLDFLSGDEAPGLTVALAENGARISVKACSINAVMPTIGGVALNHNPAPLLTFRGAGLIVAEMVIGGSFPDLFRPVAVTGAIRIGYESDFSPSAPIVDWDTNIHDNDPPNPSADNPHPGGVTGGIWIIPIARILASGAIEQYLSCPTFPSNIDIDVSTGNW